MEIRRLDRQKQGRGIFGTAMCSVLFRRTRHIRYTSNAGDKLRRRESNDDLFVELIDEDSRVSVQGNFFQVRHSHT